MNIFMHLAQSLENAKTPSDKAECFRIFGRALDKHLASVVKAHGGDTSPFENCNAASFDLAFSDFTDHGFVTADQAISEYGYERFSDAG